MKQTFVLFLFSLFLSVGLYAQKVEITGILKDAESGLAIAGATITAGKAETVSAADGSFRFTLSTTKDVELTFTKEGYAPFSLTAATKGKKAVKLKEVTLTATAPTDSVKEVVTPEERIPIITISDDDGDDVSAQSISGILSASRDPFISAAAYNLSSGGFDIRGYQSESLVFFNGIPVNNLENGSVFWSVWGGLNDVTRNRESSIDLSALDYSFGGIGGGTAFDTRASEQRKQKRFSYMFSNRAYTGRVMGTWSTGMLPSGWAFSFSGSKRWAEEGYVPGTFYNAYSYFASIDKKLGTKHLLNLTALGAPTRRGSQGSGTEEVNDLAGTKFYNPNWGYQNGIKRNSRVVDAHQPLFVLRHDWQLSDNATLMTAVGYQFGSYARTTLDWFNAPDPRGDYYRKLPSFFALDDPAIGHEIEHIYQENPDLLQIQWDDLYQANQLSGQFYPGGTGNFSQYVVGNEHSDAKKLNGSTTYQNVLSDHVTLNFGLTFQRESTHYFKELDDLLGGDYYVNLDRFALDEPLPGQSPNYNLENPEVIIGEGDHYGWDFDISGTQYASWLQGQFKFRKVDFFLAGTASRTDFWRTGNFRNGRFPNNSFGDSEKQDYLNYGVKGGATYKINGRNYLYANGAYMTRPPDTRNAYASSRNRDQLVPGLSEETVYSAEGGYQLRSPGFKGRATLFYTQFNNGLKVNRYFLPGEISNFGTYILNGVDRTHKGLEIAMQAKLSPAWTVSGAASIAEFKYSARPHGYFIQDDDGVIRDRGVIYLKNFFVPNAPQTAASLSLEYRSAKFWSATVTANYFNHTYIDVSPDRRTPDMVFGLEQGSPFYNEIVDQTKAPEAVTVDLFANKSWKVNDETFFNITLGVTNLFNSTVITGGYEQLRYNRAEIQETGINIFPPRNFYAYGTNFFIMGAVRF